MITKKDVIEKIQDEFRKAIHFGNSKDFVQRQGKSIVGDFWKNASKEERIVMREISSKELFGIAARDTMLYDILEVNKAKNKRI